MLPGWKRVGGAVLLQAVRQRGDGVRATACHTDLKFVSHETNPLMLMAGSPAVNGGVGTGGAPGDIICHFIS
jgi:hypothetical protein